MNFNAYIKNTYLILSRVDKTIPYLTYNITIEMLHKIQHNCI